MSQFTIYSSADSGAPTWSGTFGDTTTVLDAVLINGWTASVTSITRSSTTATVTTAGNHGLNTGNSTTIAGANESDYNGTFVITKVSGTVFTYTVGGSPSTPATGTITWKKLAAGWTTAFTATNKRAYRQPGGNQSYVAIDDSSGVTTAKESRVTFYEAMTAIQTGTGPMPTAAQGVGSANAYATLRKSTTADATTRTWIIAADAQTVYIFILTGDTAGYYIPFGFGEYYSFIANDGYRNGLWGCLFENNFALSRYTLTQPVSSGYLATGSVFLQRGYLGNGGSVLTGFHGDQAKGGAANLGASLGLLTFPNPSDGGIYVSPFWMHDSTTGGNTSIRGRMRGSWHFLHVTTSISDGDTFTGSGLLASKTFLLLKNVAGGVTLGVACIETSNTLETN